MVHSSSNDYPVILKTYRSKDTINTLEAVYKSLLYVATITVDTRDYKHISCVLIDDQIVTDGINIVGREINIKDNNTVIYLIKFKFTVNTMGTTRLKSYRLRFSIEDRELYTTERFKVYSRKPAGKDRIYSRRKTVEHEV